MPRALTVDKPLNPRQEAFAQALVRGMTQREAYAEAGYSDGGHSWRLMAMPNVRARVEELRARLALLNRVSLAEITARAMAIAERNEGADSVAAQSLALRALMDLARIHGLLRLKPATAPSSPPKPEPIREFRRIMVLPDGRQTDNLGNPIAPGGPRDNE